MAEPCETLSGQVFNDAFKMWCKVNPDCAYVGIVKDFYKLTGTHSFLYIEYQLPPEKVTMLRAMAGPHGYAYCKAIKARLYDASQR